MWKLNMEFDDAYLLVRKLKPDIRLVSIYLLSAVFSIFCLRKTEYSSTIASLYLPGQTMDFNIS